jgi:predicted nucleic acid-binding protein
MSRFSGRTSRICQLGYRTACQVEAHFESSRGSDAVQGAVLRAWLDRYVLSAFAGRILDIDIAVATRCAKLRVPDPKAERDALIAATALVHGMTVVTRNVDDFKPTGVEILNPWEWEPER